LNDFFQQWLYKPGALKLTGTWQYNTQKKEVKISLNQSQTDGSIFKMPVQVGLYFSSDKQPMMKTIQLTEKTNVFTITVDAEPEKLILDPDSWILMEAVVTKK
jgi:aminopeptidase N